MIWTFVNERLEWAKGRHHHEQAQVELVAAEAQGPLHIPLDDAGLAVGQRRHVYANRQRAERGLGSGLGLGVSCGDRQPCMLAGQGRTDGRMLTFNHDNAPAAGQAHRLHYPEVLQARLLFGPLDVAERANKLGGVGLGYCL